MARIPHSFLLHSSLLFFGLVSGASATATAVSPDTGIEGEIVATNLLNTVNLFSSQGLSVTNATAKSLGYVSLSSTALGDSDSFSLSHVAGKKLTLTVSVPQSVAMTIATPIAIATFDEELNLSVGTGASLSFSKTFAGAGAVRKSGPGALVLTSPSTGALTGLTGQLLIDGGSFTATAATSSLAASVQIAQNASLELALSGCTSPFLYNDGSLTLYNAAAVTVATNIQGQGSLTKTGVGSLTLSGSNSYSGGTTISSGRVIMNSGAVQGSIVNNAQLEWDLSQGVVYNGALSGTGTFYKAGPAELILQSDLTSAQGAIAISQGNLILEDPAFKQNNIAISSGATLTLQSDLAHTYSGTISGTGNIVKNGVGDVSLDGSASYVTLQNNTGSLTLNGTSLSGDISNAANLTLNVATGTTNYTGFLSGSGPLTKTGSGSVAFVGGISQSGLTTISSGGLELRDNFGIDQVVNNGVLTFALSTENNHGGSISGTGSVVKSGAGELVLFSPQTYTGGTVVSAGALSVHDDAFFGNYALTGTLNLYGDTHTLTSSAVISGTGNVNKRGLYDWVINTAQTYSGDTTIQEGNLYVEVDNALSNQTDLNLYPVNTLFLQNHTLGLGGLSGTGTVSLGSGALTVGTHNRASTFNGVISGTGTVTKSGTNNWTVNAAQSYTGLTTITAGKITQGIDQFLPATNAVSIGASGILDLNNHPLTLQALTGSGSVTLGGANFTLNNSIANIFSGAISGTGSVYKNGSGEWTLMGQSSYTGSTYLQQGSIVLGYNSALPSTTPLVQSLGTTLSLNPGVTQTIQSLNGAGTLSLGSGAWTIGNATGTNPASVYSGTISGLGASRLSLQRSNLTLSGVLSTTGEIAIDPTSSLLLNSTVPQGSIVNNGLLTIDTTNNALTVPFLISGTGSLVKTGANPLAVTHNLTYTGTTTISAGNLILSNIDLSNSSLINNSALILNGDENADWIIPYPISGSGSVTYNPLASQNIIMQGDLSFLGDTFVTQGTVTHDGIHVTLNGGAHNIAANATYSTVGGSISLLGNTTLNGLWSMNGVEINSTNATGSVAFNAPASSLTYPITGIAISGSGLTLNASSQDLAMNTNIRGTGGVTKSGTHKVTFNPPEQVLYTGNTVLSQGILTVTEKFDSISNVAIASGASWHFDISGTDVKHILSNINGAGSVVVERGAVQFDGLSTYTGPTTVNATASLNLSNSFTATGLLTANGDLNITVPDGETYRMDNDFAGSGGGVIRKYGAGQLICGGLFVNMFGTVRILEGHIVFTSLPPTSLDIEGDYSIQDDSPIVFSLVSDIDSPIVFGGTITGASNARFRLVGYKEHRSITMRNFALSGYLDLAQKKHKNTEVVLNEPQFIFETLTAASGCSINFQFDQADQSGNLRPFLYFDVANLPNKMNYTLQAINQSELFSDQVYRLIEIQNPTEDEKIKVLQIANQITAPAVFDLTPTVVLDENTGILRFDVSITKNEAGSVVKKARRSVSLTVVGLATQLQALGVSDAPEAQNVTSVLEYCQNQDELFDNLNRLKPKGNQKEDQAITPSQSVNTAQSANSSFNLQALAHHLHKGQSGRYQSPFAGFGRKPWQAHTAALNSVYQKRIQEEDPQHDFQWANLFDGMDIAGLSFSAETNYVHQRVKSQTNDPDTIINAWGTTLGSTKVLQEKYIVGVLASYLGRRIELAPNHQQKTSKTKESVRSIGVFTAYQDPDQPYYVSGFLSLGNHHYASERTWVQPYFDTEAVEIHGFPVEATGTHKGYDMTGNLEIGYTHIVNQSVALQPFVGAGFTYLYEPGYEEQALDLATGEVSLYGNKMLNSRIKKQTRTLGVQGIHSVVTDDGAYQFSSRLSYVTEKLHGDQSVFQYAYLYDKEAIIDLVKDNERFGAFEMSVGMNAAFANQWIISTNYVGHFGESLVSHTVVATAQYSFA